MVSLISLIFPIYLLSLISLVSPISLVFLISLLSLRICAHWNLNHLYHSLTYSVTDKMDPRDAAHLKSLNRVVQSQMKILKGVVLYLILNLCSINLFTTFVNSLCLQLSFIDKFCSQLFLTSCIRNFCT